MLHSHAVSSRNADQDLQIETEHDLIRNTAGITGHEISNEIRDIAMLKETQNSRELPRLPKVSFVSRFIMLRASFTIADRR
jgi:hypothetical protein